MYVVKILFILNNCNIPYIIVEYYITLQCFSWKSLLNSQRDKNRTLAVVIERCMKLMISSKSLFSGCYIPEKQLGVFADRPQNVPPGDRICTACLRANMKQMDWEGEKTEGNNSFLIWSRMCSKQQQQLFYPVTTESWSVIWAQQSLHSVTDRSFWFTSVIHSSRTADKRLNF